MTPREPPLLPDGRATGKQTEETWVGEARGKDYVIVIHERDTSGGEGDFSSFSGILFDSLSFLQSVLSSFNLLILSLPCNLPPSSPLVPRSPPLPLSLPHLPAGAHAWQNREGETEKEGREEGKSRCSAVETESDQGNRESEARDTANGVRFSCYRPSVRERKYVTGI